MVDAQEAIMLSGVVGKTSHVTLADFWQFRDAFCHPPHTTAITLKQHQKILQNADPADLSQYFQEVMKY